MTYREQLKRVVLNELSDDYENVDQIILPEVALLGSRIGWKVTRWEVISALEDLVNDGFADAYDIGDEATKLSAMPDLSKPESGNFRTYFYITGAGRQWLTEDESWWPFPDDLSEEA